MDERWRPIFGFEDYEVSNQGRVRSWRPRGSQAQRGTRPTEPRMMKLWPQGRRGDLRVGLRSVTDHTDLLVSRLVLEAFVGPPPTDVHQANHLNGNPQDNRVENLEWATPKENAEHAARHNLVASGERASWAKLTDDDVRDIYTRYAAGETMLHLAGEYGICESNVAAIVHGKTWSRVTGGRSLRRGYTGDRSQRVRGESNPAAKLTEDDVRDIRGRYAAGESQSALAREYAVNVSAINGIVHRRSWKHIE